MKRFSTVSMQAVPRFMVLAAAISMVPCQQVAAYEQPEKNIYVADLKGTQGKHRFNVRLVVGPFRRKLHKAKVVRFHEDRKAFIDGKPEWNKDGSRNWHGTDGGLPAQEIYSLLVTVDQKNWSIPKRFWTDCYDPDYFGKEPEEKMKLKLSPNGRQLTIKMYCSDGAGAYYVVWHLRADGHHSREFPSTESP